MTKALFVIVMGALSALLTLAAPAPAYACSCSGIPLFHEEFARAEAVFEGRVLSITDTSTSPSSLPHTRVVELSVLRAWKGASAGDTVTVRTNGPSSSCGTTFGPDGDYVVFAYERPEGYLTASSACGGFTRVSENAGLTFALLGPPTSGPPRSCSVVHGSATTSTSEGFSIAGFAALTLLARRRLTRVSARGRR